MSQWKLPRSSQSSGGSSLLDESGSMFGVFVLQSGQMSHIPGEQVCGAGGEVVQGDALRVWCGRWGGFKQMYKVVRYSTQADKC